MCQMRYKDLNSQIKNTTILLLFSQKLLVHVVTPATLFNERPDCFNEKKKRESPPMLLGKIIRWFMVFPLLFSAILSIFAPSKS